MKPAEDLNEVVYKPTTEFSFSQKLKPENDAKKDTSIFLYFASIIVNLLPFTLGLAGSWTSPVSLKLLSPDPDINPLGKPIATYQLSLIGSLIPVGSMVGLALFGKVYDIYGRRRTLIALSILLVFSYVTIAFATHIFLFYAPLFVIGISMGIGMTGTTMYSSEMTEDHNRAKFACFVSLAIPLGNLLAFGIGSFFTVKVFTLICALPPLMHIVCFVTILPESPVYLMSKGDAEGTRKALLKLRNKTSTEIANEIETIEITLRKSSKSEESGLLALLKTRATRRALFISIAICSFGLCAIPAIMAFLQLIFKEAETNISEYVSSLVVGVVQVLVCFGASMIVEMFGRRQLLLVSSIFGCIPHFMLGLFFSLKSYGFSITESFGWIPVTSIVMLCIINTVGYNTVPISFMSEVFPTDVKSIAISIIFLSNNLVISLTVFCFPIIMASIGIAWYFWIMGAVSLVAIIFIYRWMPETRGKNFTEIQDILNK